MNGEITAGMIPSFTSENANTVSGLGDRDVGGRDEACAAAERVTLHACDDRRGAPVDRLEHLPHRVRVGDVLVEREADRRTHPLDVGAGTEARALAGEHDGARAPDVDERLRELADQLRVERVAAIGPRQRDPQHGAVALDAERAHGLSFRKLQGSVSLAGARNVRRLRRGESPRDARELAAGPSRRRPAARAARVSAYVWKCPAAQYGVQSFWWPTPVAFRIGGRPSAFHVMPVA